MSIYEHTVSPGMQSGRRKSPQWKVPLCLNHMLNVPLITNILLVSVQRELKLFWNIAFIVHNNCFLPEQLLLQNIFHKK